MICQLYHCNPICSYWFEFDCHSCSCWWKRQCDECPLLRVLLNQNKTKQRHEFDFGSMTALKNRIPNSTLASEVSRNASDDGRQIQKFDSNVCGLIISYVTLSWFIEMTQHNRLIRASQQSRYNISTDD